MFLILNHSTVLKTFIAISFLSPPAGAAAPCTPVHGATVGVGSAESSGGKERGKGVGEARAAGSFWA
jgi:hypothetical protein